MGDMEKERYIIDKTTKRPIIIKDSEARKAGYWTICDIGKKAAFAVPERKSKTN